MTDNQQKYKPMVDKKLTKAQYEALKPYEKNLTNAARNAFVHVPGSEFEKIAELYAEITGERLTKSQMGCNTCRLNALRKLGGLYLNYGKEHKAPTKQRTKKLEKDGTGKQEEGK